MGGSIVPRKGFFELPGDHVQRYVWVGQIVKGKRVLDAGCGRGYGSKYLSDAGASYVLGIDSDPQAIKFASKTYGTPNCDFKLGDITRLEIPPSSFDVVVSFEVIEHLYDLDAYLGGIALALKREGEYILSTPNKYYTATSYKDGKSPNPFHVREYYPEEIVNLVKTRFDVDGIFVEYNKLLSKAQTEQILSRNAYVAGCAVPASLRRVVPKPFRKLWLRRKHLCEMAETTGRWDDYLIRKVHDPKEVSASFPVVLISCRKSATGQTAPMKGKHSASLG